MTPSKYCLTQSFNGVLHLIKITSVQIQSSLRQVMTFHKKKNQPLLLNSLHMDNQCQCCKKRTNYLNAEPVTNSENFISGLSALVFIL